MPQTEHERELQQELDDDETPNPILLTDVVLTLDRRSQTQTKILFALMGIIMLLLAVVAVFSFIIVGQQDQLNRRSVVIDGLKQFADRENCVNDAQTAHDRQLDLVVAAAISGNDAALKAASDGLDAAGSTKGCPEVEVTNP